MEFTNDNKVDCTTTPINEYKDYDVYSDEMFQEFAKTCGFTSDVQLKDLDFNNSYVPASKEYKLANTLMTILDGNLTAKCTWFISDEEYIFIEPTKYDDNIVAFTVGGTLYKMTKSADGTKIDFTTEPLNNLRHESDYWMDTYEELTTDAPELKTLCQNDGTYYEEGTDEYTVLKTLYDESLANGNMKALYEYSTLSDGSTERLMCDVTASVNNVLYICYGQDLIRAKFMDDDGDYILLNRYNTAEENDLYNNWFQKQFYEIDSDNHADQFFILNVLNVAKPKHYAVGTPEYTYIAKLFRAFSSREKEIVKFPVGIAPSFEGQDAIICVHAINYSGIYGDEVVSEIDFEMGHYNYRLIYALASGYVCLDRQNKYDSPEQKFDTLMNQAYKNGKCPTVDVEFSDDGHEIEVEDSSDINKLNSLRKYATEDISYSLAPSMGDNVILIPAGPVSFPSSAFGIDNKYQINNLYSNLLISCNYGDPSKEVYTWSVGDCLYVMTYDIDNDTWYTKWRKNAVVIYDSVAHANKFFEIIGRDDLLMSDIAFAPQYRRTELTKLIQYICDNRSVYGSQSSAVLSVPWTKALTDKTGGVDRYDIVTMRLVDGYERIVDNFGHPTHPGIIIEGANGCADCAIDFGDDDGEGSWCGHKITDKFVREAYFNSCPKSSGFYRCIRTDSSGWFSSILPNALHTYLGWDLQAGGEMNGSSISFRKDSPYPGEAKAFERLQKTFSRYFTTHEYLEDKVRCHVPWMPMDGSLNYGIDGSITLATISSYDGSTSNNEKNRSCIVRTDDENNEYIVKFYNNNYENVSVDSPDMTIIESFQRTPEMSEYLADFTLFLHGLYLNGLPRVHPSSPQYNTKYLGLFGFAFPEYSSGPAHLDSDNALAFFAAVKYSFESRNSIMGSLLNWRGSTISIPLDWNTGSNLSSTFHMTPNVQFTRVMCNDVGTYTSYTFIEGGKKFCFDLELTGSTVTGVNTYYKEL